MTTVTPATDEEIAAIKNDIEREGGVCTCVIASDCAPHPCAEVMALIARIDADREANLRTLGEKDAEIATLKDKLAEWELASNEADAAEKARRRADEVEIAALKAEVERLTPAFLPCHACGSKGFSDIVHGAVVLCDTCHGTGRSKR